MTSLPGSIENIWGTYSLLAMATEGSAEMTDDGFSAWLGPSGHPMVNFACRLRLDPWSSRRLAKVAAQHDQFRVYAAVSSQTRSQTEMLENVGFRCSYELRVMSGSSAPVRNPASLRVVSPDERPLVAAFMSEMFFGERPVEYRRRVAETIALAREAELQAVIDQGEIVGAVMLTRVGDCLGIYNLCVSPRHRSRGVGGSMIRTLMALGDPISLQCEPSLEAWYRRLGLSRADSIRVFSLDVSRKADILNS